VTQERLEVLLVKRQLIQTLVNGRSHRGVIPNWAGQWGLIAARPLVSQTIEETVQGAVLAQTGIDLSAPNSAERYQIVGAQPHTLTDQDNNPVTVLFLTFLPDGLNSFAADAAERIGAKKVCDGVIDTLEIKPILQAQALIGPCEQPPEGWADFINSSSLPSSGPWSLRSGEAMLADQLAERSAMVPQAARLAINTLVSCVSPEKPSNPSPVPEENGMLSELQIHGANLHQSGLWYQTYAPDQAIGIRAVTTPPGDQALPIEWQGGAPDPEGRPDWRTLSLDCLSAPGDPFLIRASLDGVSLEVRISVVPKIIKIELFPPQSMERENAELDSIASDAVWVRACLYPATEASFQHLNWHGGSLDPNHPLDRRLVSFRELNTNGKAFTLEADLGLQYRPDYVHHSEPPDGLHSIGSMTSL
jgi:hypothetical protein